MEFCLAYVPSRAELYRLNPAAWFVFRQCSGRSAEQIAAAYRGAIDGAVTPEQSLQEVRSALSSLIAMEIVEEVEPRQPASRPRKRRTCDAQET